MVQKLEDRVADHPARSSVVITGGGGKLEEEIWLLRAKNDHPSSRSSDDLSGDEVVVRLVCNLARVLLACALPMG